MTELTNSVVVTIAGYEVIFRELSVAEIRGLMTGESIPDQVGDGLFETIRLSDLPAFTSLTPEIIETLRPSQIGAVIATCKKQNPDFFAWLNRLHSRLSKP